MIGSFSGRFLLAPVLLAASFGLFSLLSHSYFSATNAINVLGQASPLVLLAVGQAFVLATRGFDISVGAVAALASTCAAVGVNLLGPIGFIAAPLLGLLVGTCNGILVGRLWVQPIVTTLVSFLLCRAAALLISDGGQTIPLNEASRYAALAIGGAGPIPPALFAAFALVLAAHLIVDRTVQGRRILMLGSNHEAVGLIGASVPAITLHAYQLCGLFSGLAGAMITLRAGAGLPTDGSGLELQSIAAAILGGTALSGGIVNVFAVAVGAIFIQSILTGLNLAAISSFAAQITVGAIIIAAGAFEFAVRRLGSSLKITEGKTS